MSVDDLTWYQILQAVVFDRFGIIGCAVFALAVAGGWVWWKWPEIAGRPGVVRLLRSLSRKRIPAADPDRFSVVVARFEHDADGHIQRNVIDALREFPAIEVIPIDRLIRGPSTDTEEQRCHNEARNYLHQSGATVAIWGTIIRHDGRTVPKLYWTGSQGKALRAERYSPLPDEQLRLPALFWSDLHQVLALVLISQSVLVIDNKEHIAGEALRKFIEKVRRLLASSDKTNTWPAGALTSTRFIFATGLVRLGIETSDSAPLLEAIAVYECILAEPPKLEFSNWLSLRNNLGLALTTLSDRHIGTAHIIKAIEYIEAALEETSSSESPSNVAMLNLNLGNAYLRLAERAGKGSPLEVAVRHFESALSAFTKEEAPFEWAMVQLNLGYARGLQARRTGSIQNIRDSASYLKEALAVFSATSSPENWAYAKTNLGMMHLHIGQLARDPYEIRLGIACFDEVVDHFEAPDHAQRLMAQNNVGYALTVLGEIEANVGRFSEAIAVLRQSLDACSKHSAPFIWTTMASNLGNALLRLGQSEPSNETLWSAISLYEQVLEDRPQDQAPTDWAITAIGLCVAYSTIGIRERSGAPLERSISLAEGAIRVFSRKEMPQMWATVAHNWGLALMVLGELRGAPHLIAAAIAKFDMAIQERQPDVVPYEWAQTSAFRGIAIGILGFMTGQRALLELSIASLSSAMEKFESLGLNDAVEEMRARVSAIQARMTVC